MLLSTRYYGSSTLYTVYTALYSTRGPGLLYWYSNLVLGLLDLVGLPYDEGTTSFGNSTGSSLEFSLNIAWHMARAMFCMIMCCFATCSLNPDSDISDRLCPSVFSTL